MDAGKPVLVGPSLGSKSKFELKEKSFATPGILNKAGLEVCIITDAPVIPLNYLPLCAGLEVGKDADLSIWNGDPLRDIQARAVQVFVDGEAVL